MTTTTDRCFYFGCWNTPGHFLFEPRGSWVKSPAAVEYYGNERRHLDGTLAPRSMKRTGAITAAGLQPRESRIEYTSDECPQGQYMLHELPNGFTAISWWDRHQGDKRGACNSTVLLEGKHTAEEMIAALHERFPHVAANLEKAGVKLIQVSVST